MILSQSQAADEFAKAKVWTISEDERMLIEKGWQIKVCWIAADGKPMVTYQNDAVMANSFARDLHESRHAMLMVEANDSWASVDIVR